MDPGNSGRLAAHVLLDVASAYAADDIDESNEQAMELAVERLHEVGCVTVTLDDVADTVVVDISDLAGGTVLLISALLDRVERVTGLSREVIINQTREIIDQAL
jgi:hypothetical protein